MKVQGNRVVHLLRRIPAGALVAALLLRGCIRFLNKSNRLHRFTEGRQRFNVETDVVGFDRFYKQRTRAEYGANGIEESRVINEFRILGNLGDYMAVHRKLVYFFLQFF